MAKSILITGAGGFIGSHLVEQALAEGREVWAGVRRTTSRAYLTDPRIHFIDLPYAHPEALLATLRAHKVQHGAWDVIVHNMGVTKCRRPEDFETVNCTYLQHLVTALRTCGMIPAQFALMSSLSAYGPIHETDGLPIRLDDTPQPNTAYGRSKLHAADYLRAQADVPHLIFYPTGVYGPRDEDYYLMFRTVRAGFDFIPGLRPQRITFIYVRDLVQAIFRALNSGQTYRRYIVAEGAEYSSTEFRRYIQRAMGRRWVLPVRIPLPLLRAVNYTAGALATAVGRVSTLNADKYRIMAQRNWTCDTSALRQELGYEPQWSLERGVEETYAWYRGQGWM
jgi:nucleoside-diphosphate-sugar epimerase